MCFPMFSLKEISKIRKAISELGDPNKEEVMSVRGETVYR